MTEKVVTPEWDLQQRHKHIFRIILLFGKRLAGREKILKTTAGSALSTKEKN